jgi:hypothetical protein
LKQFFVKKEILQMTSAGDDDWKGPFHGPYQQRISLEVLGFPGYDLRIGEDGQIQCWSMYRTGGAVNGRMMSPNPQYQVDLRKDGVGKIFRLYNLWCTAVHGPHPEDGQWWTVDHIDQDHSNNSPANLRWATLSQQSANRKKMERTVELVPLTPEETLLERRQFLNRWFIETGYEVKCLKKHKSIWRKAVNRGLNIGYVRLLIKRYNYGMNRIIAHIFGGQNGDKLQDIYDESVIIEHIDNNKQNNDKNNLRVSNQSTNMQSWHASGTSNKRKVYAISMDDDDAVMLEFDSATEAARAIPGAHQSAITTICKGNGKRKSTGRHYFSYEPF